MTTDSLRKIIKATSDLDELGAILLGADGDHNSDRSIAIIGAALVEHFLGDALYEHMRKLTKAERIRLFEEQGPLGTFDAKIQIAYAFKLLDERARDDFMLVKRIRNAFAHASNVIDFKTPQVAALCDRFHCIQYVPDHLDSSAKRYKGTILFMVHRLVSLAGQPLMKRMKQFDDDFKRGIIRIIER
jgi:mannitol repressor